MAADPPVTIAAGAPRDATRQPDDVELPGEVISRLRPPPSADLQTWLSREFFALRIEGESMAGDDIHDGDIILARATPVYNANEPHVVHIISENTVTLKRVRRRKDRVILRSSNAAFPERDVEAEDVEIQGVYVAKIHASDR